MASVFATMQVIAFLFTTGGTVAVSAEDVPSGVGFIVANSEDGAHQLFAKLGALMDRKRTQLLCVGIAPGAKLEGPIAEEMLNMPVRRFMLAQPKYQLIAKAKNLDPSAVETVILACRDMFPKA